MKTIEVKIHGTTPLLMNSNKGVNPLHPLTKMLKTLTAKRKRTEEDDNEIFHIKWMLGLYYDETVGIHIPSANVEAMIKNAAKSLRKGNIAKQSTAITVYPEMIPLIYNGPKDPEKLWDDPNRKYMDFRIGKLKGGPSIPISRPRFNTWDLVFTVRFDETKFDHEEIVSLIELGGHDVGLCDYREKYGHFDIVEVTKK